jgi:hypothetical protein
LRPFITPADLKEADALACELDRLDRHREETSRQNQQDKFHAAMTRYLQEPSDKNFSALRSATDAVSDSDTEFSRRLRTTVKTALRAFLEERFKPWAFEILDRAKAVAVASLNETKATEDRRHRELLGEPLGDQPNAIVIKAAKPVRQVEEVRGWVSAGGLSVASARSFFAFVRQSSLLING